MYSKAVIDSIALFKKLIENYSLYFSHDVLNSEGRKVFEKFVRAFLEVYPEHKPMVVRVRREPTLKNVLKLARVLNVEADI
jgi:predicted SnoaL-like aldol condensation-catalyzing enzyme